MSQIARRVSHRALRASACLALPQGASIAVSVNHSRTRLTQNVELIDSLA